jgi:CRISPR-associated endonuclease Csn1
VRKVVLEAIENSGGFKGELVPNHAFFSKNEAGFFIPKVFMPNKMGDPVPVKSVRKRETLSGVVQLKKPYNQYVNLRNNHHVLIYLNKQNKYCEEVVSFWEAIKRFLHGKPIFQLPLDGKEFITSLQINDTFLLDVDERTFDLKLEPRSFIAKHLYRVQKLSSKFYEFRLVHDNEISSTESPSYIRINDFGHRKTGWQTHNPIKLSMNAIGTLIFRDEKKDFMQSLKSYL